MDESTGVVRTELDLPIPAPEIWIALARRCVALMEPALPLHRLHSRGSTAAVDLHTASDQGTDIIVHAYVEHLVQTDPSSLG